MPARVWTFCLGLIALLLLAVVGLDAWQTRGGEGRGVRMVPVSRLAR